MVDREEAADAYLWAQSEKKSSCCGGDEVGENGGDRSRLREDDTGDIGLTN